MDGILAATRRATIRARKLASGSPHPRRLASSRPPCLPLYGIATPASGTAARANLSWTRSTSARSPAVGRLPIASPPQWYSAMMDSSDSSDAAAKAVLRAMADPLDGVDEALANEDLTPTAPWGLAVYRTAYGDDAAWRRMLDALEASVTDSLVLRGRDDLLQRHRMEVLEDAVALQGATSHIVRARFAGWAAAELRRHWRPAEAAPDEETARAADVHSPGYSAGARYNYCLQVDEICIESLGHMPSPVVKLVRKKWEGDQPEVGVEAGGHDEWEAADEDFAEEEDVGWMYVPLCDYVECCNQLHDVDFWYDGFYVRPPLIFLDRNLAHAPGFWRRASSAND
ncbi:hypothetical protein E8E14_004319 [Neopestalotiopsis sp. 37M]|nr:hypothetical protein E8E14_004319 [Neopestalotiopsis sp. 37M]